MTISKEIFKGLGGNWRWASISKSGIARVHTSEPKFKGSDRASRLTFDKTKYVTRTDFSIYVPAEGCEAQILVRDESEWDLYPTDKHGAPVPTDGGFKSQPTGPMVGCLAADPLAQRLPQANPFDGLDHKWRYRATDLAGDVYVYVAKPWTLQQTWVSGDDEFLIEPAKGKHEQRSDWKNTLLCRSDFETLEGQSNLAMPPEAGVPYSSIPQPLPLSGNPQLDAAKKRAKYLLDTYNALGNEHAMTPLQYVAIFGELPE